MTTGRQHLQCQFPITLTFSLPPQLKQQAAVQLDGLPKVSGGAKAAVSRYLQKTFDHAEKVSKAYKDTHIPSELLLLGVVHVKDGASQLLKDFGVTEDRLVSAIEAMRGGQNVTGEEA